MRWASAGPSGYREMVKPLIPLGRIGQPDEVAGLVAYLAIDLSRPISSTRNERPVRVEPGSPAAAVAKSAFGVDPPLLRRATNAGDCPKADRRAADRSFSESWKIVTRMLDDGLRLGGKMSDPVEQARHRYAEELRFTARVSSPAVVGAFATVPREFFVGPGPWRVKSPMNMA